MSDTNLWYLSYKWKWVILESKNAVLVQQVDMNAVLTEVEFVNEFMYENLDIMDCYLSRHIFAC